jgi:hypothetical protein
VLWCKSIYSWIHYPPLDKENEFKIKNDDWESNEGIKSIDELLGLEPLAEIDKAAISNVNVERMTHFKISPPNPKDE